VLQNNETLGAVGEAPYNGNWFPHLHVQAIRKNAFEEYLRNGLASLEGYGAEQDRHALAQQFPDPLQFVHLS
jgi:hypothetical protein